MLRFHGLYGCQIPIDLDVLKQPKPFVCSMSRCVFNLTRNFRMKPRDAQEAVELCARAWVEEACLCAM